MPSNNKIAVTVAWFGFLVFLGPSSPMASLGLTVLWWSLVRGRR